VRSWPLACVTTKWRVVKLPRTNCYSTAALQVRRAAACTLNYMTKVPIFFRTQLLPVFTRQASS